MSQINYEFIKKYLAKINHRWIVTGAAGFIGSHLVEALLIAEQQVTAIDNYSTGKEGNYSTIKELVGSEKAKNLTIINGDIRDLEFLKSNLKEVDYCLHQAALGSVPRSMLEPQLYHENNVSGFVNVLEAARVNGIKKIVYASSSSIYGDYPSNPKAEEHKGIALSPYALSKQINELSAQNFAQIYGISCVGLRYFNVFGPRQDPNGAYAAVIPKWIQTLINGEHCQIYGDGTTSRDFCFVSTVVLANILAATKFNGQHTVFNVGHGQETTLNQLHAILVSSLKEQGINPQFDQPAYKDFRTGDIKHSLANASKIKNELGLVPESTITEGLKLTVSSFL